MAARLADDDGKLEARAGVGLNWALPCDGGRTQRRAIVAVDRARHGHLSDDQQATDGEQDRGCNRARNQQACMALPAAEFMQQRLHVNLRNDLRHPRQRRGFQGLGLVGVERSERLIPAGLQGQETVRLRRQRVAGRQAAARAQTAVRIVPREWRAPHRQREGGEGIIDLQGLQPLGQGLGEGDAHRPLHHGLDRARQQFDAMRIFRRAGGRG